MKHTLRTLCILAVTVSVAACAPKVVSFKANPRQVCKGQPTTVSWDVKGSTVLLAQPPVAGTGMVPSSGSHNFTLNDTTVFTIKAMRNGYDDDFEEQQVVVYETGKMEPILDWTKPDGKGGLVAYPTPSPDVWGNIRIDTISNQEDRLLRVIHQGREVLLPVGGTSEKMHGLNVSGLWEIQAGLLPGEVIDDPDHSPPESLSIVVRVSCQEKEN